MFGSYDDKVYALKAGTTGGGLIWSYTTGSTIYGSPAIANGVAYIGSGDGDVYAINMHSGALRWSYATSGAVNGTPTIANGVVYCGNSSGGAYLFDALAGSVVGYFNSAPYVIAPITVVNGFVYLNGEYNKTFALALNSGGDPEAVWSVSRPDPQTLHPNRNLTETKSKTANVVVSEN